MYVPTAYRPLTTVRGIAPRQYNHYGLWLACAALLILVDSFQQSHDQHRSIDLCRYFAWYGNPRVLYLGLIPKAQPSPLRLRCAGFISLITGWPSSAHPESPQAGMT